MSARGRFGADAASRWRDAAHGDASPSSVRRAFGSGAAPPWLWDLVDAQYVGGVEEHAYAGIGDGEPIVDAIWTDLGIYQGWDTPEHRFKRLESGLRHARASAQYGNLAAGPGDPKPYSKLGRPRWPQAGAPSRTNRCTSPGGSA